MRKIDFLCAIFTASLFLFGIQAANASNVLAHWTFEKWTGAAPEGQDLDKTIYADAGIYRATAQLGTEFMFPDAGEGEIRSWSVPSAAGYVRTSGMVAGDFYRITGLGSSGYGPVKVVSNMGTSSSSRHFDMQLQFRISSEGEWTGVGDPVRVESTSQSSMPVVFDHELPSAANNAEVLELRFLVTELYGDSPQTRIQEILVTAEVDTGINEAQLYDARVWTVNGRMSVRGAQGSNVEVYAITGAKILELQNVNDIEGVSLPKGQFYIVRVGTQAFKIVL